MEETKTPIEEIMERNREESINKEDEELIRAFSAAMTRRKAERVMNSNQDVTQADAELLTAFKKGQQRNANRISLNLNGDEQMQITIGKERTGFLDHYVGDVASVATFGFVFILSILHLCGVL